ncbi:YybH family protein [Flavobacterium sp. RSB2_4_14]|uniref:YybH family protein n=1 Tax=Flavobacterium sp. RSB2_4_14 TaxID=3447665 RepID=UPI003F31D50D
MKNKMLKGFTVCIIMALAIACNPKKEEATAVAPAVDKEQIKTELQAMETAFAEGMNLRNTDAIAYYSDDVKSFPQNKPPLDGKAAVQESYKEEAAAMAKGSKISYTVNEVFPSSDGNQVVEIGSYVVVDSTNTTTASGNYMSLFEKRDGKYICIRDMSASIMPAEKK